MFISALKLWFALPVYHHKQLYPSLIGRLDYYFGRLKYCIKNVLMQWVAPELSSYKTPLVTEQEGAVPISGIPTS